MDDRVSVDRLWFTNTLLLGFDAAQNEKKYKVVFSHDMFRTPNMKGMEVVIHFLLSHLYPKLQDLLKFIWPINDKSQAHQFRQIIIKFLEELKDKLELPPIQSTLGTCTGKRFHDLLWKLSQHALQTAMQKEFPTHDVPRFPSVDNITSSQKIVDMITATKLHIIRQSRMFVSHAQSVVMAQEQWKSFDKMMYDEYTSLTEELALVKKELVELGTRVDLAHLNDENAQERRKQQIIDLREMWKAVSSFDALVAKNKETCDDVLSGKAYPHQLSAADLRIDNIPEELVAVAAPLVLPPATPSITTAQSPPSSVSTSANQAPQFALDGLVTLYTSALSSLARQLPPSSTPLPIHEDAPKLAQWAKSQNQQRAAIRTFEAELTSQAISWRKELQETVEVRDSIDHAMRDSSADGRFRMQPLPPPASYVDELPATHKPLTSKELGFASPASRAPKQDVLDKLANSVRRVALRGTRTFAAIANELLPPNFSLELEDSQNLSIGTMSSINTETFFAPSTPAPTLQQSTAKRKVTTTQRNPRPSIMDSASLYKTPAPGPTSHPHTTKLKPAPKPHPSSQKQASSSYDKPTSKNGSALNLDSIFSQPPKPDVTSKKKPAPKSTAPQSSSTRTRTTKPRPTAMDLLVNDLADHITGSDISESSEYDDGYYMQSTSKPMPSRLKQGPTKSPKKKLAWAESADNWLHSHTNTLDAIDGTAFKTTKQIPRTPLPHERTKQRHTTPSAPSPDTHDETSSPPTFIDTSSPTTNTTSLFSEDLEWSQFMQNSNNSNYNSHTPKKPSSTPHKLPQNGTATTTTTSTYTPNKQYNPKNYADDQPPPESMEFDSVDSPMHMSSWLTNTSSDPLFSSSPFSFSSPSYPSPTKPKQSHTPKKQTTSNGHSHVNMFPVDYDEYSH